MFDNVVDPAAAGPRERFEAVARSVRDILSQRWVRTEQHLRAREPQARLLPVDGVPHRPLARQQHHQPAARPARATARRREEASTGSACSSRSPTPAWATAASAGSPRASSTRWRPAAPGHGLRPALRVRHLPADDRGRLAARAARQLAAPARPVGGRPARRSRSRSSSAARSRCAAATCASIARPAVDPDRHALRPAGGRLRRQDHQHPAPVGRRRPGLLRLPGSSAAATSSARWPSGSPPRPSPACSTPTTPRAMGQGLRFVQEYFLVACSLADLVAALPPRATPTGARCPTRSRSSSTTPTRRWPSPS